jgi:hypothetical protein
MRSVITGEKTGCCMRQNVGEFVNLFGRGCDGLFAIGVDTLLKNGFQIAKMGSVVRANIDKPNRRRQRVLNRKWIKSLGCVCIAKRLQCRG